MNVGGVNAQSVVIVVGLVAVAVIASRLGRIGEAAYQQITDAAPIGSTPAGAVVSGTAGLIGAGFGLPTPRQIAENRQRCIGASSWWDASINCSASDFVRWLSGGLPGNATDGSYPVSAVDPAVVSLTY